jgi:hypothetical protein
LILVNPIEDTAQLTLSRHEDDTRTADLSLVVRNSSPKFGGLLRVRFFTKDGAISELVPELPDPLPNNRPALTTPNQSRFISTGQTRPFRVTFTVSPQANPSVLDGHLIVTVESRQARSNVEPLVVATQGAFASTPATGKKGPQPPKPTLVVTSWWPLRHSRLQGERQRVFVLPSRAEQLDRREVVVLGADDTGEQLRVVLRTTGPEGSANGLTPAELKVDQVGGPATYKGDLILGSDELDKLALTVHVRDLVLWPLLLLAVGALLGGYGTRWWENKRRQSLLIARARRAYNAYADAVKDRRPEIPPPRPDPDPKTRLDTMIVAIKQSDTDEQYNEQVDAVAAYETELRQWLRIAKAAEVLDPSEVPAGDLQHDVRLMDRALGRPPKDSAAREGLADRAERLAELVDAFVPVWNLWVSRGMPDDLDPNECYSAGAHATEGSQRRVFDCLDEKREALEAQPPVETEPVREGVRFFMAPTGPIEFVQRFAGGLWNRFDELQPEAVERRVRMFDWWVALAAGLITLLAYLLTVYDNNFGTPGDYAKTFTAGFVGQLAGATIAWNLFPPFRSYRATRTTPAKPAEAD